MVSLKFRIILFAYLISSFSIYSQGLEEKASVSFQKYCPAGVQERMQAIFFNIIRKIPKSAHEEAFKALEIVLPQTCMADFPIWLIDRTFNLAIYGIHEHKLKDKTIGYLTELVPVSSIGKMEYIDYGIIIEHMTDSGIPKELVFDLLHNALDSGYSETGTEALSYYYTQALMKKKSHKEAMVTAMTSADKLKRISDPNSMKGYLFADSEDYKGNPTPEEAEKYGKSWDSFWKSSKNKIHYKESFKRIKANIDEKEIISRLRSKEGIPFGYRLNRPNAMDINGLISLFTGEKTDDLPYIMDSYCTFGSVNHSPSKLNPGDLIFFGSLPGSKESILNGIALDNNEFLMVTHSRGIQIFNLNDDFYSKRFIKACRILK